MKWYAKVEMRFDTGDIQLSYSGPFDTEKEADEKLKELRQSIFTPDETWMKLEDNFYVNHTHLLSIEFSTEDSWVA